MLQICVGSDLHQQWTSIQGTLLTNSVELTTAREATSCVATRYISQHFMESEGSLPHSQELSTCPYPEPDQSSAHLSKIHLNIIHYLRLDLPSDLFPSGLPTNDVHALLFSPFVLHTLSISVSIQQMEYAGEL
jgi:hypothetical protein